MNSIIGRTMITTVAFAAVAFIAGAEGVAKFDSRMALDGSTVTNGVRWIDASCYVLDCLWNMRSDPSGVNPRAVERNYEPFIRALRAKRPDVPIVMAGMCDAFCGPEDAKDLYTKALYDKLIAEGWKNLFFLPKDGMLGDDFEGTVDGVHPNDLGMRRLADAYGAIIRQVLLRPADKL